MPRHADLLAARQAASACVHASKCLLFVANDPGFGPYRPGLIAKHLDELTRTLPVAGDAIPRVENDLSPEAPGLVEAGGMARPTAHRLAFDLATDLAEFIREIDPRLVPREPSGPGQPCVALDLVKEHLPAIVAKLTAKPPEDTRVIKSLIEREFRRINSLIEREWWDATARLNAAGPLADVFPGIGLFRPTAPPPEGEPADDGPAGSPGRDRQATGADASGKPAAPPLPPSAQPYHYLKRIDGSVALIDCRTLDPQKTWLGVPVQAAMLWPNPSDWTGVFGVNIYFYRGVWVCSCWLEGKPGFHKHPLNTEWLDQITFWEVDEDRARRWFDENHQPLPDELNNQPATRPSPEAAARPPADEPSGTADPAPLPEAAAGSDGSPRADRQAAGADASGSKARPPGDPDREAMVAEYLLLHPHAKSPEICRKTGIPEGTLRKLTAWKTRPARLKAEKPVGAMDAMRRAIPLTETMVAARPARIDDPADLAAVCDAESLMDRLRNDPEYRDIVASEYLQTVDSSDRAAYHRADPIEQIAILAAWKMTGMS